MVGLLSCDINKIMTIVWIWNLTKHTFPNYVKKQHSCSTSLHRHQNFIRIRYILSIVANLIDFRINKFEYLEYSIFDLYFDYISNVLSYNLLTKGSQHIKPIQVLTTHKV